MCYSLGCDSGSVSCKFLSLGLAPSLWHQVAFIKHFSITPVVIYCLILWIRYYSELFEITLGLRMEAKPWTCRGSAAELYSRALAKFFALVAGVNCGRGYFLCLGKSLCAMESLMFSVLPVLSWCWSDLPSWAILFQISRDSTSSSLMPSFLFFHFLSGISA